MRHEANSVRVVKVETKTTQVRVYLRLGAARTKNNVHTAYGVRFRRSLYG
jgi:hypothetical protein